MSALPLPPSRLLTPAEFAELPEDTEARYELQEGNLVMSPRPRPRHQLCLGRLWARLAEQLPAELEVLPEVDVDLELAPASRPGFVRAPDLVVVRREVLARVEGGGLIRASEVVLAVEITSPGTDRMDTVVKHGEYADAGIPHYWIVTLDDGVALIRCHLGGEFGYVDAAPVGGRVSVEEPFPATLDLDALL